MGTRDDRDGRDTRRRAARLHAKDTQQAPLERGVDAPGSPTLGILLLDVQVEGQQTALREVVGVAKDATVVLAHDALKLDRSLWVHALGQLAQVRHYVQE